jgi:glycosyltransferase involved in cell wall biosynthesis
MANPLVSIVIPAFNSGKYIFDAINSCKNQTYKDIEIIVIDDGSTDDSLRQLRIVDGIKLVSIGENRGACYARNLGIAEAQGQYIKFLDSDDLLEQDCIEKQIQRSLVLDDFSIVYGDFCRLIDGCVTAFGNNVLLPGSISSIVVKDVIHTTTPLHRKKLLETVSGFDTRFKNSQEWNLHVRLIATGVKFYYFPDRILYYREHDSEHRIYTQRKLTKNLDYEKEKIWLTLESVRDKCDDDALAAFAMRFWSLGRIGLRSGNQEFAEKCFQLGMSLTPKTFKKYWRPEYKIIQGMLGTHMTERLFVLYKLWM